MAGSHSPFPGPCRDCCNPSHEKANSLGSPENFSLGTVTGAVLAGGLGTRLRSVVYDRPKVLALVGGRPFLAYLLEQLSRAGIQEVVLLTGYRGDQVRNAFGDTFAGMRLLYSQEPSPLGTAGAIRHALPMLGGAQVLLLNGDSHCPASLERFFLVHRNHEADFSLVLTPVEDTARFGKVQVSSENRLLGFEEKQAAGGPGWINAGIYLIKRPLLQEIPPGRPVSLERDMFPQWARNKRCFAFPGEAPFLDIGTPESYQAAEAFFAQRLSERDGSARSARA